MKLGNLLIGAACTPTLKIDLPRCCTSPHSLHCEETGRPRTMHIRYAIDKESAAKGVVAKAADGASRKSSRNSSKSVQQDGWTEVADKRW